MLILDDSWLLTKCHIWWRPKQSREAINVTWHSKSNFEFKKTLKVYSCLAGAKKNFVYKWTAHEYSFQLHLRRIFTLQINDIISTEVQMWIKTQSRIVLIHAPNTSSRDEEEQRGFWWESCFYLFARTLRSNEQSMSHQKYSKIYRVSQPGNCFDSSTLNISPLLLSKGPPTLFFNSSIWGTF